MLVDVLLLRHEGRKRPREEVLAAKPVRGELTLGTWPGAPQEPPTAIAILTEPDTDRELLLLRHLGPIKLRGDDLVVPGIEIVTERRYGGGVSETWPQAWWCRLVRP